MELQLRKLKISDKVSFLNAVEEFNCYDPNWEFAPNFDESVNFQQYIDKHESIHQGRHFLKVAYSSSVLI